MGFNSGFKGLNDSVICVINRNKDKNGKP